MTVLDEPVQVVRNGAPTSERDRYNKPILAADVVSSPYSCKIAPHSSTEPLSVERDAVESVQDVYFPPRADVRSSDRLRFRGTDWQIDGDPAVWPLGVVVTVFRKRG